MQSVYSPQTVLVTRPLKQNADGTAKLALNLASNLTDRHFVMFAEEILPDPPRNITFINVKQSGGWYTFFEQRRHIWNYLKSTERKDIIHFLYTPNRISGFAISRWLKSIKNHLKIATITSEPKSISMVSQLQPFDRIIVPTRTMKTQITAVLEKPVSIIPPGVILDNRNTMITRKTLRRLLAMDDGFYCLCPSDFSDPGFSNLLSMIIPELITTQPKLRIVMANRAKVASDHHAESQLKTLASNNQQKIVYIGETNQIHKWLQASDLIIFPAVTLRNKLIPPMILLEAITLGTPFLAFNLPHLNDCFDDVSDILIPLGDHEKFIDRVVEVSNNPQLLTKIQSRQEKMVKSKFSALKIAEQYERIYTHESIPF